MSFQPVTTATESGANHRRLGVEGLGSGNLFQTGFSKIDLNLPKTNNMKNYKNQLLVLVSMVSTVAALGQASQPLTITYFEQPTEVKSSLQGTTTTDFSSWAQNGAGAYKDLTWSGVGTIDEVYLQKANLYGGATGTGYYPVQSAAPGGVGGQNAIDETVVTLNKPSSYFGLWWSAGDPYNTLSFYSGNTLVATFNTKTILDSLPGAYFGNPTAAFKGQDAGEPFAFLNVYGKQGVTWDKIVFDNPGSSGFESDNWTVRQQAWGTLPGEKGSAPGKQVATVSGNKISLVAAPEPSHVVGVVTAAVLVVAIARKKNSLATETTIAA